MNRTLFLHTSLCKQSVHLCTQNIKFSTEVCDLEQTIYVQTDIKEWTKLSTIAARMSWTLLLSFCWKAGLNFSRVTVKLLDVWALCNPNFIVEIGKPRTGHKSWSCKWLAFHHWGLSKIITGHESVRKMLLQHGTISPCFWRHVFVLKSSLDGIKTWF